MCVEDAVEAAVGHQCVECVRAGRLPGTPAGSARVTRGAVATIVVIHLLSLLARGEVLGRFGLVPVAVGAGEWWRLLTSALLHGSLLHLGFNALLLYRLGEALELRLGHARAAALLGAGAAGGAFGVVALAWATVATDLPRLPLLGNLLATAPGSLSIGASGAVFGLMGAFLASYRARGIDPWRTDIGALVLLNLVLTFLVPAISVGGHVGGLLAGTLAGRTLLTGAGGPDGRRRATRAVVAGTVVLLALAWWLARSTLMVALP